MLILHTADWHLGRALYGRRRYAEQQAFLEWLAAAAAAEQADALLVAGDIFDTATPSNQAQELYFRFLARLAQTACRHVVVVAGNHDSPSFLDAPAHLLRALNVHVVGAAPEDPAAAVLNLRNGAGETELIVCAVPYLRERDVRSTEAGEQQQDKDRKITDGTAAYYKAVFQAAAALRSSLKNSSAVPIVGTGHLFATASAAEPDQGDGVRELYVGTLNRFPARLFPPFDYLALGHLHVAQSLNTAQPVRYSGSPLAVGFGEAGQQKSISAVCFEDGVAVLAEIPVPVFQRLQRISGDFDDITRALKTLKQQVHSGSVWLEIAYTGSEIITDLQQQLESRLDGSPHQILRVKNHARRAQVLAKLHEDEVLADLDVYQVFQRCLDAHGVPPEQQGELYECYRKAVAVLNGSE